MPSLMVCVPLLLVSTALAQPTLRPLLVSGDVLPDGTTVTGTSDQPVIDADHVAALVATSGGKAIVRIDVVTGEVVVIANEHTPSPTHPGFSMSDFRHPAVHAGLVVFSAGSDQATGNDTFGLYRGDGGPVEVIVDATTDPLLFPLDCFTDGTSVLFKRVGAGDPLSIVGIDGGAVQTLAARSMPTPDGGELIDIERGVIHGGGGCVAARVTAALPGANYAVYCFQPPSNDLTTIARTGDPMPGNPGRLFRALLACDVSGDAVLYTGADDGWPRSFGVLCLDTPDRTTVIADGDTPVPGAPGQVFDSFTGATDGQDVVFLGSSLLPPAPEVRGAYWWRDGTIHNVVSTQDAIDGLPVTFIRSGARSVDAGRAVLSLELGQFERVGLYLAEFPSPCAADLTGDGQVDSGDLGAFVTAFLLGDTNLADLTGDGQVDSGDLGQFVDDFLAGC